MSLRKSIPIAVVCLLAAVPAFAVTAFTDMAEGSINADAVAYLSQKGIIQGYSDGSFREGTFINRAEFAKIVMEARAPGKNTGANCFPDVHTEWFAADVCAAKAAGILGGYPDGTFKPSATINFSEAARIVTVAYGLPLPTTSGPWYEPYVRVLGDRGAIPSTISGFDKLLTRGEMADILYRLDAGVKTKDSLTYDVLAAATAPAARRPKIVPLNDTWSAYTSGSLGVSIHVPTQAAITPCNGTEKDMTLVPMTVLEGDGALYIRTSKQTNVAAKPCVEETTTLATEAANPSNWWKITVRTAADEAAVLRFANNTFGGGCETLTMTPSDQPGVYDVVANRSDNSDAPSPDVPSCWTDFAYAMKYQPSTGRLAYWDMGQDVAFIAVTQGTMTRVYDPEIVRSFRFEN